MIDQLDFIIKLWNLEKEDIDWNKSCVFINNDTPEANLYLNKKERKCVICNASLLIKGSKTQLIKTVLRNGNYALINLHKREYKCSICNKRFTESLSSIKPHRNRSLALDMKILEDIKDTTFTYQKISEKYSVSKTYILDLFDKYINVKRLELPEILSIDEIYSKRLTKTKYSCILYSPIDDKIVDCLDSRHHKTLEEYLYHIPLKERNLVKYFTSDLNNTYRTIKNEFFNNAIHAVDSFHVVKNLNDLLNQIRIKVMKEYDSIKSDNSSYWLLKKFSKLLFINYDDIEDKEYDFKRFNMILDKRRLMYEMLNESEELKEAYYLSQEYKSFNSEYSYNEAPEKLDELIDLFVNAKSKEMVSFGYLLIRWRNEIINSFIRVNGWRLSNGKIERANRYIKLMFSNAFGYSNFPRTRNRILYSYNKDASLLNAPRKFNNKRIMKSRGKYNKR